MNHPIQPLVTDDHGVVRFQSNAIVKYLLHYGEIDLNDLAECDFSSADREQFMQLIGCSLSVFASGGHAAPGSVEVAQRMAHEGEDEKDARIAWLENELAALRTALRAPIARLYNIHSGDLQRDDEPGGDDPGHVPSGV